MISSTVSLFLDFEGKCWVDEVSVKEVGPAVELVTNGDFEAGDANWGGVSNHAQSRVEAGMGRGGSAALAVVGNLTRTIHVGQPTPIQVSFGDAVDNAVHSTPLATDSTNSYVVSLWFRRHGVGSNVYVVVGTATNELFVGHAGTPGTTNSLPPPVSAFGVVAVSHDLPIVGVTTANVVRATVAPATGVVALVRLDYRAFGVTEYQLSDGHYTSLAMADDGVAPDTAAGDGVYSVSMPGFATNRTFVRYRIVATDGAGAASYAPARDDPSVDYSYWVESHPPQTTIPNWQLLVDGDPVVYPVAARTCVVTPDGDTLTDVRLRHRGNPGSTSARSGLALRVHRSRPLDLWFAKNETGINIRHRGNDDSFWYRRVVNEWLAYGLQELVGLATPRVRHICAWINGVPTITMSLEAPAEAFMTDHGLPLADYLSRAGWSGRRLVAGDPELDNFAAVRSRLENASGADLELAVRTNLVYEAIRPSMAVLSITANGDQKFNWNMFQHRQASDGRWRQYPWDFDFSFNPSYTNLHPYYETTNHPGVWGGSYGKLLGSALYYPETGPGADSTWPYRTRQQQTLWQYTHTIFTTNFLYPKLDAMEAELSAAYGQIGVSDAKLLDQVTTVKGYIVDRRDFYINGSWSDKDAVLWNPTNVYDPSTVVINEIMAQPLAGGEYVELHNTGAQSIDLSWWWLTSGDESYRLPLGTTLAPGDYLAVADKAVSLTNVYDELSSPGVMTNRYPGMPLWDWPSAWLTNREYRVRVVSVPQLTLPNSGATVTLFDLRSNVIDSVTYSPSSPWPAAAPSSLELLDAASNNALAASWDASLLIGTPAGINSVVADSDRDGLDDRWEQAVIDASGGSFSNVGDVSSGDDFDLDGLTNGREFVLGTDPTIADESLAALAIANSNGYPEVTFPTLVPQGAAYVYYPSRYYTLQRASSLLDVAPWTNVVNFVDLLATGAPVHYTNAGPEAVSHYRYKARLPPIR